MKKIIIISTTVISVAMNAQTAGVSQPVKRLQETKGDVTLLDLGNYITKNVSQQSVLLNGKSQTPTVSASTAVGTEWQTWKLK